MDRDCEGAHLEKKMAFGEKTNAGMARGRAKVRQRIKRKGRLWGEAVDDGNRLKLELTDSHSARLWQLRTHGSQNKSPRSGPCRAGWVHV